MDRLWIILTVSTLIIVPAAGSTPLDTAYDLLYAIEFCDGAAMLETFTESLSLQISVRIEELRQLALADPSIAARTIRRFGGTMTIYDLENLSSDELLGRVLEGVHLSLPQNVDEEYLTMSGRNAEVTLSWIDGGSVSFTMVWEESSWRISDTVLLSMLFY
jgi:hypothetical protein